MAQPSKYMPKAVYKAVILAFALAASGANAVEVGQAQVTSAQNEPLAASIAVTGIDATNFSVNVGNEAVYAQLKLKDQGVRARFVPTGANSGRIELSSNQPISDPFADIVLDINHAGDQEIVPQTVLLPIAAAPKSENTPIVASDEKTVELPKISASTDALSIQTQPLQVIHAEPPPLDDGIDAEAPLPNLPTFGGVLAQDDDTKNAVYANTSDTTSTQTYTPFADSDVQSDILKMTITRTLTPVGEDAPILVQSEDIDIDNKDNMPIPNTHHPVQSKNTPNIAPLDTQSSERPTYIIQRGDNLWSIANQLAAANDIEVGEVMQKIYTQNPDAFFGGNKNQLKAGSTLTLPNYEIVPSQRAIASAISARTTVRPTNKDGEKSTATSSKKPVDTRTTLSTKRGKSAKSLPRPALPQARLTLVTPQANGSATGTANKGSSMAAQAPKGALAQDLMQTRKAAATKATRINALNQEVTGYAERIKLQNQRLAELEQRLKQLKNK